MKLFSAAPANGLPFLSIALLWQVPWAIAELSANVVSRTARPSVSRPTSISGGVGFRSALPEARKPEGCRGGSGQFADRRTWHMPSEALQRHARYRRAISDLPTSG